ncbi:histidine kinase [Aureispira sp. CCB-E]|uniref:sensor histidine kinase n=1 Tax=Aureispira sp. CCB-E TaxID=3051121 RepID=UPI0028695AD1|nr:histidine kinase [Aureispira sp. CCB-E]WMX12721.1 histidine kinase [Aureispira sp. CCB-E]
MRTYAYIILLLFFYTFVNAQDPYHWKLTDDDGLPNMEIYGLYQDSKGYMWIATDGGLCRYDGKEIITYTSEDQKRTSAASIQEDSRGTIWYKNFAGQLFFIDSNNTAQIFPIPDSIKLNTYFEYSLTKEYLQILSSVNFYTYHFKSQQWKIGKFQSNHNLRCSIGFFSRDQVNDSSLLYIDCNNELWLRKKEAFYSKGVIPSLSSSNRHIIIIGLENDSALIATTTKVYIDHIDSVSKLRNHALIASYEGIATIYSNKGTILIGTQKGIVVLLQDKYTKRWKHQGLFLKKEQISATLVDRDGNIWLGTLGHGVLIIPSLKMTFFDSKNSVLPDSKIGALAKKKEDLFLGTHGRISKLNTKSLEFTLYPPVDMYPTTNILCDTIRNQILFNSANNYILSLSDQSIKSSCHGIGHHSIIYKKNQLIVGTFLALITYPLDNKRPTKDVFNKPLKYHVDKTICDEGKLQGFIASKRITALSTDIADTSRFWTGINDSLFYWQDAVPYSVLSKEGKAITPITIRQAQDSILWVGTPNQGLYGIKNKKEIYHFTVDDGLPSNNCKTIAADYPYIWVGTNLGIVKIQPNTKKIELYNQLDGLLTNNIDRIEIANKKVWATSSKGLIAFDVNTPSMNKTAPLIRITQWNVNDSSLAFNKFTTLPYEKNNIQFTFQALALKSRNTYTYEYRLLGLDTTWISQTSSTNFVRFPSLNAGQYTFEVRARNEDGVLSKTPAGVSFCIQAPYWETWWFKTIIGFITLSIVIGLVRLRYQFLQRKQATQNLIMQLKMQALQAQMNPHFIFNAMSTIQSFWMYKDSKTALIYHAKFAKLMRLIFNYSNEKSIPIKDEIDFLKLYIDLEKIRLKYDVTVQFDIDPLFEEEGLHIPPLLIQPIVENSFKHGFLHKEADGHLLIKLELEDNYIKCTVEDDGVGLELADTYNAWKDNDTTQKSSSFVTQDRLTMLNRTHGTTAKKTTYKISDLTNIKNQSSGTRTELWIPITDYLFSDFQ